MSDDVGALRMKYGLWVVLSGLVLIGILFYVAVRKFSVAADVAAVMGSVSGVVGTIVGAFFGVQAGAAGKEKAESDRDLAQKKVERLLSVAPPGEAQRILKDLP